MTNSSDTRVNAPWRLPRTALLAVLLAASLADPAVAQGGGHGGPGGGGGQGGGHMGGGQTGGHMGGFGGQGDMHGFGGGSLRLHGGAPGGYGGLHGQSGFGFRGGQPRGSGFGQNGDGLSDYAPYGRPVYGCDPTTPSRAHPGC